MKILDHFKSKSVIKQIILMLIMIFIVFILVYNSLKIYTRHNSYIEVPDFERHYLNQYRLDKNINLIYSDNDHVSEFDRLEIKGLLQSCGITIQKEEYRFGVQKLWCKIKKNETKQ